MRLKFPDIFFTWLTYILVMALVIVYVLGFFDILFFRAGNLSLLVLIGIVVIDGIILFANKKGISASRHTNNKLSNGDENPVQLYLENNYLFPVSVTLIDEIPVQFQVRDFQMKGALKSAEIKRFDYIIKPFERGEYHFGQINVLVKSPLGLIERRYKLGEKS